MTAAAVSAVVASRAFLPTLPHGIPPIGIGTYELRGDDCVRSVCAALRMGYRLIDTAAVYRNEELVGEGIATSGVSREELYVVVKIAMKSMGSDAAVREGILESIRKLRIEYADCVLMHWPGCGGLKPGDAAGHHAARARCWRIMSELLAEGKVRSLGVSNFLPRHFAQLHCFDDAASGPSPPSALSSSSPSPSSPPPTPQLSRQPAVAPILNQIELHPLCVQQDVDAYCRGRHGMVLQQYSPLGKGDARLLQHPRLLEVYAKYFAAGRDDGQDGLARGDYSLHDVVLMWGLSQGYCTLVRSHTEAHLRANLAAATDFFASQSPASCEGGAHRARPLLTSEQLDVICHLRHHMGVDKAEDVHLCWYSSEIA